MWGVLTKEEECADKEGRDEVDGKDGVGEVHPGGLLQLLRHTRGVPQIHQGGCCGKREH